MGVIDPDQPFDLLHNGRSKIKLSSDYGEFRNYRERTRNARSLDHLIRAQQQRLRNSGAQ
jgi:hypothetical protein